jgi:hypothetical protein
MKKIKLFAILLATALVAGISIFYACEKGNNKPEMDPAMKNYEKLMQEGAIVHNETMEYVYNELLKAKSVENFMSITEAATNNFVASHPFFQSDINGASDMLNATFKKLKNATKSTNDNLWNDDDEDLLSADQKEWLMRVNDVIDKTNDIKKMDKELDNIKNLAIQNGNEEIQYVVIAAVEIAKASLSYWNENSSKWQKLSPNDFGSKEGWFSWKAVGRDDVSGAIGGAVAGAVVGGMAGGAGAVPGAASGAVAGGIAGSAASAVGQVWDRFIGSK